MSLPGPATMAFMTGGLSKSNGFFSRGKLLVHRAQVRVGGLACTHVRQFAVTPTHPGVGDRAFTAAARAVPAEKRSQRPVVAAPPLDENVWLTGPRGDDWWTGIKPQLCPGFNPKKQQLQSLPLPNLKECTQESALAYFNNTWTLTELLFSSLQTTEAFLRPPDHGLRHPLVFYYGHPAVLYVNKLRVAGLLDEGVNAFMEDHFETGVDEMSWDDMSKNEHPWPPVSVVREYRQRVYNIVVALIKKHLPSENEGSVLVNQKHPLWSLYLGFEHERIHIETSSVLMRETPLQFVLRPRYWPTNHPSGNTIIEPVNGRFEACSPTAAPPVCGVDFPANEMVHVKDQIVHLGKPLDFPSFGWDNEYGSKAVHIEGLSVSKFMVSNGEMLAFVKDNGYTDPRWWSEMGWKWRQFRNAKWPKFWQRLGAQGRNLFGLRTQFEVVEMPWSWPAVVNWYEGQAFCAWKASQTGTKLRLINEAEHHAMRDRSMKLPLTKVSQDPIMTTIPDSNQTINTNLVVGSESPVGEFAANSEGFHDVMGNAWCWSTEWFHGFEGFAPHPVYDDFSVPCFDERHNMIMGGSFISTGANGSSVFSRFAFRPHFHQHAGFRYASGPANLPLTAAAAAAAALAAASPAVAPVAVAAPADEGQHKYETDAQISAYLSLHFGQCTPCAELTVLPQAPQLRSHLSHALQFPQRTANLLADACSRFSGRVGRCGAAAPTRVLDLGCAVGGASFELARHFDQVVGIDFSPKLIEQAKAMKDGNTRILHSIGEGELRHPIALVNPQCTCLTGVNTKGVSFLVGDATALPPLKELTGSDDARFDAVLLANLLCRLSEPQKCLDRLSQIVRPGGVVMFVSPYSWMEQFTKKENWIGGYYSKDSHKPVHSASSLEHEMVLRGFTLKETREMPLLIPDHARKFQYIVSHATVFQLK